MRQTITHDESALRNWPPGADPQAFAAVQISLGNTYRRLPTGDRVANLQRARACYEAALAVYRAQCAPFDYALTLHQLGTLYRALPTDDRDAHLQQALACYEEALRYFPRKTAPRVHAMIEADLAGAREEACAVAPRSRESHRQATVPRSLPIPRGQATAADLGQQEMPESIVARDAGRNLWVVPPVPAPTQAAVSAAAAPRGANRLAVGAFFVAIFAFGPAGMVLGIIALGQIRDSGGQERGEEWALPAIAVSTISTVLLMLMLLTKLR